MNTTLNIRAHQLAPGDTITTGIPCTVLNTRTTHPGLVIVEYESTPGPGHKRLNLYDEVLVTRPHLEAH